jgi:DNA-binding transcriptional regulator LsrR (DeoR family)
MGRKQRLVDPDLYALAAAYLRGQGQSQDAIARSLEISQSAVWRLLNGEIAKRCLTVSAPVFACPKEMQALWFQAQAKFFPSSELLDKLKARCRNGSSFLQRALVIYGAVDGGYGPAIVPAIQDVIARAKILGVTFGRTISELIATLQAHLAAPLRTQAPITIFPLCGEPLKDRVDPHRYSSSALAAQLDELVNGRRNAVPPSLAGVPTFIPRRNFTKKETQTIRRFIRLFAGYSQVFGDEDAGDGQEQALVDQADTLITSVGVIDRSRRGIFLQERVELGDLTEDELVNWVVGDIGGVMIPRRGLASGHVEAVRDMNSRWTGFSQDHLKKCAARAVEEVKPGVVVLAVGAQRAEMVLRIVEENLVSELLIDAALAEELKARIDPDSLD